MFEINDLLDAILLGGFFFGVIFTVGTLLLGIADLGFHGDHGGHGDFAGDVFGGLFNLASILAFITWFGGIGYLFRNALGWNAVLSLILGAGGGLVAAYAVSWFLIKILRSSDGGLDPADYETVGVVARVTSSIRAGGYGEIVYELGGTRQVGTARSATGNAIGFGTEVVVLRVEKGVAIVEPFEDLLAARDGEAPGVTAEIVEPERQ
jgi:membrane protein implicated in regulation of membrane protease activity